MIAFKPSYYTSNNAKQPILFLPKEKLGELVMEVSYERVEHLLPVERKWNWGAC